MFVVQSYELSGWHDMRVVRDDNSEVVLSFGTLREAARELTAHVVDLAEAGMPVELLDYRIVRRDGDGDTVEISFAEGE